MLRLNECDLLFGHCLQASPYHGMDRPDSLRCSHPIQKQPNRLHREQICIELHTNFHNVAKQIRDKKYKKKHNILRNNNNNWLTSQCLPNCKILYFYRFISFDGNGYSVSQFLANAHYNWHHSFQFARCECGR